MISRYRAYVVRRADATAASGVASWRENAKQSFPWTIGLLAVGLLADFLSPEQYRLEAILLSSIPALMGWFYVEIVFLLSRERARDRKIKSNG